MVNWSYLSWLKELRSKCDIFVDIRQLLAQDSSMMGYVRIVLIEYMCCIRNNMMNQFSYSLSSPTCVDIKRGISILSIPPQKDGKSMEKKDTS